jgi:prevent-host-death family protein
MKAVGVKELKNKLSEFLRIVRRGESVLVTEHGTVIAQLAPAPLYLGPQREAASEALRRLAQSGHLRLAETLASAGPLPSLPKPSEPIDLRAVLEDSRAD